MNSQIEALVSESIRTTDSEEIVRPEIAHREFESALRPAIKQSPMPSTPIDPISWQLRQFIRCLPIVALVRDLEGRTILANHELGKLVDRENVVGLTPHEYWGSPAADWIEAHDSVVREKNASILCVERIPIRNSFHERLSVRFPIRDTEGHVRMTGAIGFDLEYLRDAEILRQRENGRRPCRIEGERPLVYLSDYGQSAADSLLADFVRWIPAVAAVKSARGHLLCVNRTYHIVTGKGREVIGRLPCENWSEETADLITAHDQLVRETGVAFLSVENLEVRKTRQERLNLRFPIFGAAGELEMIGVLGFDYNLIKKAIEQLGQQGASSNVYLFEPTQTESLEVVPVRVESIAGPF